MAELPTDFRGDPYGFVACVWPQGRRPAFTSELCASRQDAARLAFAAVPALRRVWTERRYVGKPCGGDIQWIERREVEATAE